jgi:hypothetical protein
MNLHRHPAQILKATAEVEATVPATVKPLVKVIKVRKPVPAVPSVPDSKAARCLSRAKERSDCADCDHFETRDVVIPEEPPIVPDLPEEGEGDFIDGGGWAPVGGND